MSKGKTIVLDLTDCKSLGELHERIRVAFKFPKWYGANWSAFWDLLWSDCDAEKLEVVGLSTLPKELDGQVEMMMKILDRLKEHLKKCTSPVKTDNRKKSPSMVDLKKLP